MFMTFNSYKTKIDYNDRKNENYPADTKPDVRKNDVASVSNKLYYSNSI